MSTAALRFSVLTVEYKTISFKVQDVGGQDKKIRPLWCHYCKNTQNLIFAVDINDGDRLDAERGRAAPRAEQVSSASRAEQERAVGRSAAGVSTMQDLSNATSAAVMTDKLGLHGLCQQWLILVYCAAKGDRLYGGLDWLLPGSRRYSWQLL
uniref:Uncharacterized protein n=1 Tax=Peronospora matthiolae TaxID=2874970 RepID=A0AAV1U1P2_9STRA